jgi:hypothetical protein
MTLDQIKALSLGSVGDVIATTLSRRTPLPVLPSDANLPEEPCTYDCTDCMAAGRCLIYDATEHTEGYVHTDDDVPEWITDEDDVPGAFGPGYVFNPAVFK